MAPEFLTPGDLDDTQLSVPKAEAKEATAAKVETLVKIEDAPTVDEATLGEAVKLVEADTREEERGASRDWIVNAVRGAVEKIKGSGGNSFEVKDSEGNSQQEGVPVDRLINFLIDQIDPDSTVEFTKRDSYETLRDEVLTAVMHPINRLSQAAKSELPLKTAEIVSNIDYILAEGDKIPEQYRKRLELVKTLLENSARYFDLDRPSAKKSPETGRYDANHWRTKLEAYYIYQENGGQPVEQARQAEVSQQYYQDAAERLNQRREVMLHEKGVTPGEDIVPYRKPEVGIERFKAEPDKMVRYEHPADDIVRHEEPKPIPSPEKIRITDMSEVVKAMAWRIAENRLNERITVKRERGVAGFLKGIGRAIMSSWVRTGERGFLTKFYQEALQEITDNQDLMADIKTRIVGKSEGTTRSKMAGKGEQWMVLDSVMRQMDAQAMEDVEKGVDVEKAGINFADLVQRHLRGEFADRAAFETAAREAINAAGFTQEQFVTDKARQGQAEGRMYASNLWELAESRKAQITEALGSAEFKDLSPEQQKALMESVVGIGNLDVQLATKLRDLNDNRPERPDQKGAYLGFWDRVANIARNRPILGLIVNPLTVGMAGYFAGRAGARRLVTAGAVAGAAAAGIGFGVPILAGMAVAGVFAYANRRRNLAYDRGMEQRRGALGMEGEGRRAAKLREFGFAGVSAESQDLIDGIEAGDTASLQEAAALLEAERAMRQENGRGVDLIRVSRDEGEGTGTNLVTKSRLRTLVAEAERAGSIDMTQRDGRVAEIIEAVTGQDKKFEKYRRSQSIKAGLTTAALAGVIGEAASEIKDYYSGGSGNGEITALEYLRGERPQVEHYEVGGIDYPVGEDGKTEAISQTISTTDGHSYDVQYSYGPSGKPEIIGALPPGVSYDEPSGAFIYETMGSKGGAISAESWDEFAKSVTSKHGDLFNHEGGHWVRFYDNKIAPVGDSYHAEGYTANSEGTELMMDFSKNANGDVTVDLSRMLGHVAYDGSHRLGIDKEMLNNLVIGIGPRARELSHDLLTAQCQDGKIVVPADIAQHLFKEVNGSILPADGIQVTGNQLLNHVNGEANLGELTTEFSRGDGNLPEVPPTYEHYDIPPAQYVPQSEIVPPIPIAPDFRRPIGNVPPVEKNKKAEENGPKEEDKAKAEKQANLEKQNVLLTSVSETFSMAKKEATPEAKMQVLETALGSRQDWPEAFKNDVRRSLEKAKTDPASLDQYIDEMITVVAARQAELGLERQETPKMENLQTREQIRPVTGDMREVEAPAVSETEPEEVPVGLEDLAANIRELLNFQGKLQQIAQMTSFEQRKEALVDLIPRAQEMDLKPTFTINGEIIKWEDLQLKDDKQVVEILNKVTESLEYEVAKLGNEKKKARKQKQAPKQFGQNPGAAQTRQRA